MKKTISLLFCLCILLSSTGVFAKHGIDAEGGVAEAVYGTAKIDGIKDEVYPENAAMHARHILEANSSILDGSTAKIWLAWDYEALYVYAEVDEKTPACASTEEYNCDSVEIFIDENHTPGEIADTDDQQYRVASRGTKSTAMYAD